MPSRLVVLLCTLGLGACAWTPKLKFWDSGYEFTAQTLQLRELRRALLCGTPTEDAVVRLFDDAQALRDWDANDSLDLGHIELPEGKSFIILEQGLRRTGGYSVEMARTAELDDQGTLRLSAEWLSPAPDRMVTQMLTSLCVLAAVDAMPYQRLEVYDSQQALRAERDISR